MKMKLTLIFTLTFILVSSCGFKVLDKSQNSNFSIEEIRSSGEMRINYKIKNNILANSKKGSENQVIVSLNTKKIKSIKEKNIKNEITKYQISLTSDVKFFSINGKSKASFNKSVVGDYVTGDSYSTSINNEKKVTDDLIDNLSEKILDEIILKLNDL